MSEVKIDAAQNPNPQAATTIQGEQSNETTVVPPMPEGGSEKFYNTETGVYNWEAHAREAEFKSKQRSTEPVQQPQVGENPEAAAQGAGLDYDVLTQKIVQQGDLDPSDYDALVASGVPRELVEGHVDMFKAELERHTDAVVSEFGGPEGFEKMAVWAKENLSEQERVTFTEMLNNPDQYKAASKTLQTMMGQTYSGANQAVPSTDVKAFSSEDEMIAAMSGENKIKYQTDPSYRLEVAKRAAASNFGAHNPRFHTGGL